MKSLMPIVVVVGACSGGQLPDSVPDVIPTESSSPSSIQHADAPTCDDSWRVFQAAPVGGGELRVVEVGADVTVDELGETTSFSDAFAGLWRSADGTLVAGGDESSVAVYVDGAWTGTDESWLTGEQRNPNVLAVWGEGDVWWVAGSDGLVARRSGEGRWSLDMPDGDWRDYTDLWGSDGTIVVVGFAGTVRSRAPDGGWVEHQTGVGGQLHGVWGHALDDIWVVGHGALIHGSVDGLWTADSAGASERFRDVWGSAADDVYAVGESVWRYDGESWSPFAALEDLAVSLVSGTASDDIWFSSDDQLYRWDGEHLETARRPAGTWRALWVDDEVIAATGAYRTIYVRDRCGLTTRI